MLAEGQWCGYYFGFPGQNFATSTGVGLTRSDRCGVRTSDDESDFVVGGYQYKLHLRRADTLLSSDSESTPVLARKVANYGSKP